jgi:hypothetical protein
MELGKLIRLDEKTGCLYWKPRTPDMFKANGTRSAFGCCNNWNARYSDKPCLTAIGSHGYRNGNLLGKSVLAHRVVFELVNGYAPDYVDHINGNKLDNRPCNLRPATNSQNIANSNSRKNSSSKYLGVCWSKNHKKWIANITKNNKAIYIGIFEKEKDAALAYNIAAIFLHKQFARLNVL